MQLTDFGYLFQTIAAISSAIAAIAAVRVANAAFAFQKSALLKKAVIDNVHSVLKQLYELKSLSSVSALEASDDEVAGMTDRIESIKSSLLMLEATMLSDAKSEAVGVLKIVRELNHGSLFCSEGNGTDTATQRQLDQAIKSVHRIYKLEMK